MLNMVREGYNMERNRPLKKKDDRGTKEQSKFRNRQGNVKSPAILNGIR